MSRKDYQLIAWGLATSEPSDGDSKFQWKLCCERVACVLGAKNAKFNKNRFLEACSFSYYENHLPPL